jgi:hypothetical protein
MEETMCRFGFVIGAAAIVCPEIGTAAVRQVPKFDIAAACRGSGAVETVARCTRDEETARNQLAKLWPRFKQSDANRCVQIVTTGGASGYVELLTCLQAASIEEKKPADPFGPLPSIEK